MIQINHMTVAPISIARNISSGLIHRACFIIIGMRKLFSSCCISINSTATLRNHISPKLMTPTMSAGIAHNIGQAYGMNSVSQAMSASVNLSGIFIPKRAIIRNQA